MRCGEGAEINTYMVCYISLCMLYPSLTSPPQLPGINRQSEANKQISDTTSGSKGERGEKAAERAKYYSLSSPLLLPPPLHGEYKTYAFGSLLSCFALFCSRFVLFCSVLLSSRRAKHVQRSCRTCSAD